MPLIMSIITYQLNDESWRLISVNDPMRNTHTKAPEHHYLVCLELHPTWPVGFRQADCGEHDVHEHLGSCPASQRSKEQTAGNLSPKGSWSPHHNPLVRPAIFWGGGRWWHLEGGKALRFPMIPRFGRWFSERTANVPWSSWPMKITDIFQVSRMELLTLCKQDGCSLLTRKCLKPENSPQKRQQNVLDFKILEHSEA